MRRSGHTFAGILLIFICIGEIGFRAAYGSPEQVSATQMKASVSRRDAMPVTVAADQHRLTARGPDSFWLEIVWRFHNTDDTPLYVLSKGPLSMTDGQPFLINHTVTDHSPEISGNIDPVMEFIVVAAHGSADLRYTYPLPPLNLKLPRQVVARFAVSHESPGSEWGAQHNRDAVRAWQHIVFSAPFTIDAATAIHP